MAGRLALLSLLLATVSSSSVFSTATSVAGASEAELCFAQAPTIVGTPGEEVVGTEGPDVVVTNGAAGADTLGGDDLLCITGVSDDFSEFAWFETGEGNDRITSAGLDLAAMPGVDTYNLGISPGLGFDEVSGGAADELIHAEGADIEDTDFRLVPDPDVVRSGGGDDLVFSSGYDVVDLGTGNDQIYLLSKSSGVFKGGTGRDTAWVDYMQVPEAGAWTLDNQAKRLTRDGLLVAELYGFVDFWIGVRGDFAFIGSSAGETFRMRTQTKVWAPRNSVVDVNMHGGNDTLAFYGSGGGAAGSRYDGGSGADWVKLDYSATVEFDMRSGVLQDTDLGMDTTRRAVDFENARLGGGGLGVLIRGTAGPNILRSLWAWSYGVPPGASLYGRGGDDVLIGGGDPDLLIGGPGHDVAKGSWSTDRCEAEVRVHCEL